MFAFHPSEHQRGGRIVILYARRWNLDALIRFRDNFRPVFEARAVTLSRERPRTFAISKGGVPAATSSAS
jgi:hypothetical protein